MNRTFFCILCLLMPCSLMAQTPLPSKPNSKVKAMLESSGRASDEHSGGAATVVNMQRKTMKVPELKTNDQLLCASLLTLVAMNAEKSCSVKDLKAVLAQCKYTGSTYQGLVSCDTKNPAAVLYVWINDTNQNNTLISTKYSEVGCGHLADNWVCILGAP